MYKEVLQSKISQLRSNFAPFCVLLITQRTTAWRHRWGGMGVRVFLIFLRRGPPLFASQSLDEQRVIGFVIIVQYLISLAGFVAIYHKKIFFFNISITSSITPTQPIIHLHTATAVVAYCSPSYAIVVLQVLQQETPLTHHSALKIFKIVQ